MPYRAQVGGVMGSGLYPKVNTGVDVAGGIDAIARALAGRQDGLIRKAMMQREFQRQDAADAQAAEDRAYQRQRDEAASASAAEESQYNRSRQERLDSLAEAKQANEEARYRAENGITGDSYVPTPSAGSDLASGFQVPSIRQAYMSGGSAVGQFQRPDAAVPSVGQAPEATYLPGSSDYTVGTAYQKGQLKRTQDLADKKSLAQYESTLKPETGHFSATPGVDPTTGKPTVYVLDTKKGTVHSSGVGRPQAAGGAQGELMAARLATAAGQATDADHLMTTYEDQVLAGKAQFTVTDAYLAKKMLAAGPGVSTMAESTLNSTNPRLAGYVRAAKAAASAERMITPRGGSNALMSAETMLSGAGASADRGLIEQARGYRKRLVQGLSAHVGGQSTGDIDLSSPATGGDSTTMVINGRTYKVPR